MSAPMSFRSAPDCFRKDGKPCFVISGEIHYFRIDPALWEKHLVMLKHSGANTTSTYIPWDWHEVEEGRFDFSGDTHPGRDLLRYIGLCRKVGLSLIVKPGPYILAEYRWHGLPGWFLRKCTAGARALDEHGNVIAPDVMSYMSEEYLRHVFLWYDAIMPVIAPHQESRGGPVTMMQVCNEVGVFQWLSGKTDYNPVVVRLYREFLARMYGTTDGLNRIYGTQYRGFEKITPPGGMITTRQEYCAYHDFHLFYRHYFAVYLDTLVTKIRSLDIDVQLTHNIPGWIYGNAAELPMLISTYEEVMRTRRDIVFGLDHIPEFVSYRNAHSDLACNKILSAMQPYGPVWAAEFQAGTRAHHVKCDASDMEMFYLASLAHGLKGFNYYMFSQGKNPPGKGFNGRTFYYQTPVDVHGKASQLYAVTKKLGNLINREAQGLLEAETRPRICVGLYKPYFYTELTSSQLLKERRLRVENLGLSLDPRFVREELLFNGLLRALQTLNRAYDMCDLERNGAASLLRYRQLWVVTTEYMDATTQEMLAAFVRQGGHLVLYPAVPTLDLYLRPCTILKETLGLRFEQVCDSSTVSVFGIEEFHTVTGQKQIFEAADAESVATAEDGRVCGIRKQAGEGWILAFGFAFGYSTDDHLRLYEKTVALDRILPAAKVSDPDVQVVVRRGKKRSYMFLLNYHNAAKRFTVNGRRYAVSPFSARMIRTK